MARWQSERKTTAENEAMSFNTQLSRRLKVSERPAAYPEIIKRQLRELTACRRMIGELRESEKRFRLLAENARDIVYRIRLSPRISFEYISPSAEAITGYTPREYYADRELGFKLISPGHREIIEKRLQDSSLFREPVELRWLHKNGSEIWVEQRNVPVFDKEHQLIAIEGIARDITERKKAVTELQEKKDQFNKIFNLSPIGMSLSTLDDGRYVDVNESFLRSLGYQREEVIGRTVVDLNVIVEPERRAELIQQLGATRRVSGFETKVRHKSGQIKTVLLSAQVMEIEGRPYLITSAQDITEFRNAMKKLQQSEAKYATLVEQSNDGIIIIQDGILKFANSRIQGITGFTSGEVIGRPFTDFVSVQDREAVTDMYRCRLTGQETPNNYEIEIVGKNEHHIPVEINACRIEYEGKPANMAIIRNIADRKSVEAALQESIETMRLMFDSVTDGVVITSLEGNIIGVNQAISRLCGYNRDEIIGLNIFQFFDDTDRARAIANFNNIGETDRNQNSEYTLLAKNSKKLSVEMSTAIYRDRSGNRHGHLAIFRDITERLQAEIALRDSEERFRRLAENAPDAIIRYELAPRRRIAYVNPAMTRMTGYTAEEYYADSEINLRLVHPGDRETLATLIRGETIPKTPITLRWLSKTGQFIWTEQVNMPVCDSLGNLVAIESIARDITARKQAEDKLRDSEEKLRHMFEAVTDGITVTDLEGNITEVNDRVVQMHGYRFKDELTDKTIFELIGPRDHAGMHALLKRTLEQGSCKDTECTLIKLDGTEFLAELSASVLKDSAGNPASFIATSRDISGRKQQQEHLIVTDRLASIGELASGIAHEINNPLTSVIGFSQLVMERDIPSEIRPDIEIIYNEAQRASRIVKNLLTFARKHPSMKQLVNLNTVINKVLELRAYEQKTSNIQVVTDFATDLPEITADNFQLQQVFLNIIINAEYFMIQAHGRGTLTISTQKVGDLVIVSLNDDGPGIDREHMAHLFDPFFTTKPIGKGTGLGLSICHGIITEHGGRIYARSEPGKGATFVVELHISTEEGSHEK